MVRTDLAFERNRERIRFYHRRQTRVGCLVALVALIAGLAVAGYVFKDEVRLLLRKVAPSLQSRGRAVAGRMSLIPLTAVIEQSELALPDKAAWKDFVDNAWTIAEESGDVVYRRQDVIDLGRRVVESPAGLYYAMKALELRGLDGLGFDAAQRESARQGLAALREDLAGGRLGPAPLDPLKEHVHPALIDLKLGAVEEEDLERSVALRRTLVQGLVRIREGAERRGNGIPLDMRGELERALGEFKRELESRKLSAGGRP